MTKKYTGHNDRFFNLDLFFKSGIKITFDLKQL